MMDSEEREVYYYLKAEPGNFVPASAVCRHAGGKHRYREAPDWARPVLMRMVERGILEVDAAGAYRLSPMPQIQSGARRWVSPEIAAILQRSGKKFAGVIRSEDDMDSYYENL
jgi:hypothetical protein